MMYRAMVFASALLAGLAVSSAAGADSISELLEKGIYTEETAGDLDQAISIYEKVLVEAKTSHLLAAQAQYHIGQCLLKKGKKAEATAAFEKLIGDFPDAKDLVAKARKLVPAGLPLGPVPWVDGEVLQLRFRMATGMGIGTMVYTAQSAELEGRKIWRVGSRTLVTLSQMSGHSHVDADWETFQPIQSVFMNSLMGTTTDKYSANQVCITVESPDGTKSTRTLDLSKVLYDNEQAMDVMRRLPWAPGYKTTLTVLGEMGSGEISIPLEMQAQETVNVPAGQFECFKIHLGLVNQTFWLATDPHRYLVKFSANGVDAELSSIGQDKPGEPRRYEDGKLGFSLAAPNDWFFYQAAPEQEPNDWLAPKALQGKHVAIVYLLDPQAISTSCLFVDKLDEAKADQPDLLRTWAEAGIAEESKIKKDLKARTESWQQRTISGLPALSVIADYTDGKRKMVDYVTYVEVKSAGWKVTFGASIPQEQFDQLRKPLDTIIDSLKVKQP